MDKAKKMKVEKKHSSEKKRKYDDDEDKDFSQKVVTGLVNNFLV